MSTSLDEEIWANSLKVRRSVIPRMNTRVALIIGVAIGVHFFMVLRDPSRARALGALGATGRVDWAHYFTLALCVACAAGLLCFVLISAWLLTQGRSRGLATPVGAQAILIIALRWSILAIGKVLAIGLAFAALMLVATLMPVGTSRAEWGWTISFT